MSYVGEATAQTDLSGIARRARTAARVLATLPLARRNQILLAAADELERRQTEILAANEHDCAQAEQAVAAGQMSRALLDRLRTSERGVAQMAAQVRAVAELPDPLGRTLAVTELDSGMTLYKVTCPLGVVGIIFESRPDVIPQVAALTLKSGNAVLLKGGREAAATNEVLVAIWHDVLAQFLDLLPDAVSLLHSREDVGRMLALDAEIDLIIPRGSQEFVRHIAANSRIPVLGHGKGLCHVYVDRAADLTMAQEIAFDAKVQYPAACNSMETLLVHEEVAPHFLPQMIARYVAAGVEVRGCPRTVALSQAADVSAATDEDWATEYSDLVISIKVVASADDAIAHIARYGSSHTEAIVTTDAQLAARFLEVVDAAGVYHNASTRFADGFRYGLGAELGISTGKLHARGPVGLEGLTTYKYKLFGDGQTVGKK